MRPEKNFSFTGEQPSLAKKKNRKSKSEYSEQSEILHKIFQVFRKDVGWFGFFSY